MPIVSTPRIWGNKYMFMWKTRTNPIERWLNALEKCMKFSRRLSFVHLIRIREVTSMDLNCGNSSITKQMMRCELLQGRKTEPLYVFGIDGENDLKCRKSPKSHWLERCVCTISRPHRTDWFLSRSACWTTRQISQSGISTWYRGKSARHVVDKKTRIPGSDISDNRGPTTIATRNECCAYFNEKKRKRLNDKLDPKIRECLEWRSENWERYFSKEREFPPSSSSSQWSSTSWWSSHEWSSTWKGWQQHSWQDDKWSAQR